MEETTAQMKQMSIKYGGIWQSYHQQLEELKAAKEKAEQTSLGLISENTTLRLQNSENEANIKRILLSLTEQSNSNLQYHEILQQIRSEKEALQNKLIAYESQDEYCRKQIQLLHGNIQHWQHKAQVAEMKIEELKKDLEKRDLTIQHQEKEKLAMQEKHDQLFAQLAALQDKYNIANHSVHSKDRMIKALNQDKAALKAEVDTLKSSKRSLRSHSSNDIHLTTAATTPTPSSISQTTSFKSSPTSYSQNGRRPSTSTTRSSPRTPSRPSSLTITSPRSADSGGNPSSETSLKSTTSIITPKKQEGMVPATAVVGIEGNVVGNVTHTVTPTSEIAVNPWFQPVLSSEKRVNYRKSATPTQMRRRSQSNPTTPSDSH